MADVLAARDAAPLTDLARVLKAAARAVILYPDGHPAIGATLERLTQLTTPSLLTTPLSVSIPTVTRRRGGVSSSCVVGRRTPCAGREESPARITTDRGVRPDTIPALADVVATARVDEDGAQSFPTLAPEIVEPVDPAQVGLNPLTLL